MATTSGVQVGKPAPDFTCKAVVDGRFKEITLSSYLQANHWLILNFFPKAFSFICPTEIKAFSARLDEFLYTRSCAVAFASTDSEHSLKAWNATSDLEGGLGGVHIPLLSDCSHQLSKAYGVLIEDEGVAQRALFIIDPKGVVRSLTVNDADVGRSVDEALRILDALKFHDEFGQGCPVDWKQGDQGIVMASSPVEKFELKKSWSEWARPKLQRAWSANSQRSVGSLMSQQGFNSTSAPVAVGVGGMGASGMPSPGHFRTVSEALPMLSPHHASQVSSLPGLREGMGSGASGASSSGGGRSPSLLVSPMGAGSGKLEGQMDDALLAQRMENVQAAMANAGVGVAN